ncbi:class I SAM-dependent methyltransferase [Cyanobium sp. N.Huapi 1H5]|uniref:class I SAM-dependent methyltransferase n=1 Tax=Cyanobium sp. N.Huapi 1H5 TaxID=2823719 RepID=UPI0037BEA8A9|nr:class I SAM-dependent methyltransferase [Cyanobium sp. N.Huapi 1H5]
MASLPSALASVPWNHNSHYYDFILSRLPASRGKALDVGCGKGDFAVMLGFHFEEVDAIDLDQRAIQSAREHYAGHDNVRFHLDSFLKYQCCDSQYDFISMISSLHHMDLEMAIAKATQLLRTGGAIFILGCYRESGLIDFICGSVAIPANMIYCLFRGSEEKDAIEMVTVPATCTISQIGKEMHRLLPGHVFRRHLFWRYSVEWRKT